jgi:hypothetical protein
MADVSAGAGVVLAAAGLYLLLRTPDREVSGSTSAYVSPLPGGGQIGLGGSF